MSKENETTYQNLIDTKNIVDLERKVQSALYDNAKSLVYDMKDDFLKSVYKETQDNE